MEIRVNDREIIIENIQAWYLRKNKMYVGLYTAEIQIHAYSKGSDGRFKELTSYEKEKVLEAIERALKEVKDVK